MLARILTATDSSALDVRLRERFEPGAAASLLAARDVPILALDLANEERARALVAALRAHGATAEQAGTFVAAVATNGALARTRAAHPAFAGEIDALEAARRHAADPPARFRMRDRTLDLRDEARVMGILNVTPDSFYERVTGVGAAVARARELAASGASLIDIGGQSYAHWNEPVAADEERARVVPVVEALVRAEIDVALSIDTFKAAVAGAALAAGAHLINDCSGLSDPALPETVASYDAGLVVMHLKGELNVRAAASYRYGDAMAEIVEFLHERTERARAGGVARDAIAIDPGLEFGKEPQTDLEILDRFGELRALGYPILLAGSRKSFIGRIFDRPAQELLVPSLAAAGLGISAGARVLRVHDVAETVQLAKMYAAVTPRGRRAIAIAAAMPGTPRSGNSRSAREVER